MTVSNVIETFKLQQNAIIASLKSIDSFVVHEYSKDSIILREFGDKNYCKNINSNDIVEHECVQRIASELFKVIKNVDYNESKDMWDIYNVYRKLLQSTSSESFVSNIILHSKSDILGNSCSYLILCTGCEELIDIASALNNIILAESFTPTKFMPSDHFNECLMKIYERAEEIEDEGDVEIEKNKKGIYKFISGYFSLKSFMSLKPKTLIKAAVYISLTYFSTTYLLIPGIVKGGHLLISNFPFK